MDFKISQVIKSILELEGLLLIRRCKEMNTFNDNVISWLLEEDNPAIAYRTRTELLVCHHQKLLY